MTYTNVHGVELLTDRDRIAILVEGLPVFPSTRGGPQDFEPQTISAFVSEVGASPGCVIDVGAYTGLFTLLALRAGAPEVIAIEPNEAGYGRLLENLEPARPHNVRAIRAAASSRSGPAHLAIASERLGICSTGKVNDSCGQPIDLITIDSLVAYHPVTVMKLDVEGHELRALQGAENTLKDARPTLFVEVNSRSGGDRTAEIKGFLADFGYQGEPLDDRNMVFRHALHGTSDHG